MASSARWMPVSRSTIRASSEGIMPSRAQLPTPPDRTRTCPATPRAASIRSRSICAITLRAVLAWQTRRTVSATRVGQRLVVGPTARRPLPQHLAELRAHGIGTAHRHRPAPDREVVGRELTGPGEVSRGRLAAAAAEEPLAQRELGARLLVVGCGQALEPTDLGL